MQLLSNGTIAEVRSEIDNFEKQVEELHDATVKIINSFENNTIVKSLYESGRFGKEEQDKIIKIKEGIEKYHDLLIDGSGLIPQTYSFLEEQAALNDKGVE